MVGSTHLVYCRTDGNLYGMTSYMSTELTGMTWSSLRPPSTTHSIYPRVSSNEMASTASPILSSWPKAPHAFKHISARFFARPLMLVMVQPPLSVSKTFLPILQVWGTFRTSGLSRPHTLIAFLKILLAVIPEGLPAPLVILSYCQKLDRMTVVLTFYPRVGRAIVQYFGLHSSRRDVWFTEDDRMGRHFLHEKVLVYLDIADAHSDIRASPV